MRRRHDDDLGRRIQRPENSEAADGHNVWARVRVVAQPPTLNSVEAARKAAVIPPQQCWMLIEPELDGFREVRMIKQRSLVAEQQVDVPEQPLVVLQDSRDFGRRGGRERARRLCPACFRAALRFTVIQQVR